ncbi:hypothetical protein NQ315_010572 [Exocentrus adspersus]|uniref:Daxx histone-binding domain-containing protein n=1 Tax=Exocentrus adspersus TaxID=1586481 RepID=A0AAV8W5E5_9CUCU|nr:hypothetical protein NQ315_010572 [Exocentrus adspersus]
MSDIITLSSDEEDTQPPPKKKIKPSLIIDDVVVISKYNKDTSESSDVVVLSDEETGDVDKSCSDLHNGENPILKDSVGANSTDSITILDDQNQEQNEISVATCEKEDIVHINKYNEVNAIKGSGDADISNDKENSVPDSLANESKSGNHTSVADDLGEASTSVSPAHSLLLENFLQVCEEKITSSQYEHLKDKQFPVLRKYYRKCGAKLGESTNFLKLVDENMVRAKKSPAAAVISFNEILQYVKEVVNTESVEVSEGHRIKLKKLEKMIKLLLMRIRQLENAEINFDDEEDSSYLQLDRYINRLNKVHKKYCELLEKNPYSGRITYEKLDFVDSEYNEINRAISKKYKNNQKFPSYYEMEEYIRKVVTDHTLDLSESKIKSESVRCFKKLGELLQNRRKKELYDAHYAYIRDSEDPAKIDVELDSTLKQNFTEGQIKIEKICEEYIVKEELGEEPVLSDEDSVKSEESENEEASDK